MYIALGACKEACKANTRFSPTIGMAWLHAFAAFSGRFVTETIVSMAGKIVFVIKSIDLAAGPGV